jgi:hypothetical protein
VEESFQEEDKRVCLARDCNILPHMMVYRPATSRKKTLLARMRESRQSRRALVRARKKTTMQEFETKVNVPFIADSLVSKVSVT